MHESAMVGIRDSRYVSQRFVGGSPQRSGDLGPGGAGACLYCRSTMAHGNGDNPTPEPQRSSAPKPTGNSGDDMPGGLRSAEMAERLVGSLLGGHYRIQSHLGAGGFGDVFRAVQEKTGQTVAVKVLRPRH